ncbi:MAG TPA: hypothetical protein VLH19_02125, partial [Patescibacteria group bacterium]|nr:hypothetical protein [Patescibacteria group bacterium]
SEKISSLLSNVSKKNLVISEGIDEITIIAAQELQDDIKAHFSALPKNVFTDLVGICVRFPSEYIEVPNALFSLISGVSLQRINIIELVSTYTQLMIVVRQEDRERTVGALQKFF